MRHNYPACTLEPGSCNYVSPRAGGLQQEKPVHRGWRAAPFSAAGEQPLSLQLEESPRSNEEPAQPNVNK